MKEIKKNISIVNYLERNDKIKKIRHELEIEYRTQMNDLICIFNVQTKKFRAINGILLDYIIPLDIFKKTINTKVVGVTFENRQQIINLNLN